MYVHICVANAAVDAHFSLIDLFKYENKTKKKKKIIISKLTFVEKRSLFLLIIFFLFFLRFLLPKNSFSQTEPKSGINKERSVQ